jgi:hypothetical protein
VDVPEEPGRMMVLVGLAEIVKSAVTVTVMVTEWLIDPVEFAAITAT